MCKSRSEKYSHRMQEACIIRMLIRDVLEDFQIPGDSSVEQLDVSIYNEILSEADHIVSRVNVWQNVGGFFGVTLSASSPC